MYICIHCRENGGGELGTDVPQVGITQRATAEVNSEFISITINTMQATSPSNGALYYKPLQITLA